MKIFTMILALALWTAPLAAQEQWRASGQPFNCVMISTATALTELTDCAVLTSGQRRYITDINWSSSIISTTTNFMTIQYGTGTACATGTVTAHVGFALAFTEAGPGALVTPIRTTANAAICFVHPGAGTRNVNVRGYIQ
jgi:hypothetical protein